MLDDRDRKILDWLQRDAAIPLGDLADNVSLSVSACSRRVQRLKDEGYISGTAAMLDRGRMNVGGTVFVVVNTSKHTGDWLDQFRTSVIDIPEIVEVHRLAGNLDYIIKMVVRDIAHYDEIYRKLVSRIELFDVSAYFSMETLKATTAVPTKYAG